MIRLAGSWSSVHAVRCVLTAVSCTEWAPRCCERPGTSASGRNRYSSYTELKRRDVQSTRVFSLVHCSVAWDTSGAWQCATSLRWSRFHVIHTRCLFSSRSMTQKDQRKVTPILLYYSCMYCSVRYVFLLLLLSSVQEQFCSRKLRELRCCIEFMKRTWEDVIFSPRIHCGGR